MKPARKGPAAEKPKPDEEQAPAKKLDLPSADEQKRLMHEIDEVYKPGEANAPAAQVALARKLLEDGRKDKAKRAEQFVLFRRAGEIAGEAGDPDLMLEAVDAIAAAGFNIQPFQVKARFLERFLEQGSSGDVYGLSIFGESCMRFAEEAAASGAMDEASDVLGAARHALTGSRKRAQTADHAARAAMARTGDPAWQWKLKAAEVALGEIDYSLAALAECAKGLQRAGARARSDRSGPGAAEDPARRSGRLPGGRPLAVLFQGRVGRGPEAPGQGERWPLEVAGR